jgi:hypothetical protein
MTTDPSVTTDFRMPTASKWRAPRAVADGGGGTIIAVAEVAGPPERVFRALTTNEVAGGDTPTPTVRRGGPQTSAFAGNGASPFGLQMAARTAEVVSSRMSMRRGRSS